MIATWLAGLVRVRPGRMLGVAGGVAVAVALLAAIGGFIGSATATMTQRAASNVVVDWQVQLAPGADVASATRIVRAAPGVSAVAPVAYGRSAGLSATTVDGTQTTGAAVVLGLPAAYTATFPGQIRPLSGSTGGVLLAQQTAANLHVAPGDRVRIDVAGTPSTVQVSGVVDLPQANSLFQTVGAPVGAQPTAPPDNVVLLPRAVFDRVYSGHADRTSTQLHVTRSHLLPTDPASAYIAVTAAANNLTARLAGTGLVGDDLAAALDAARSDAAYANVLFLFLGLPGVVLAALLTMSVANADRETRRRDQALLRLRGAPRGSVLRLAAAEGVLLAVVGCATGLLGAQIVGLLALGTSVLGDATGASAPWLVAAIVVGVALAVCAIVVPAARDARSTTVVDARRRMTGAGQPLWQRSYLDVILLAIGAVQIALTTQRGYTVVLAPEGVPTVSVDYWAFLGPACLWAGGLLIVLRVVRVVIGRPRIVAAALRPVTGDLAETVAAIVRRRRGALASTTALLAAAVAFAVSTSVFNATYQQQAEVDARLTNGADVRVELPAGAASTAIRPLLQRTSGVAHAEPVRHRYAYVGADLQDLYGIDTTTIRAATSLQDAYFANGTADQVLTRLRATPDGVLVSQETAHDYQLQIGDHVTLRLPRTGSATPVPIRFTYVGQVLEFPTAPRDSFLVANSNYVAAQTKDPGVSTFLVGTDGTPPAAVATAIRRAVGTAAKVTPIGVARSSIGSSLTSVDLGGLTRVELTFALLLGVAAGGVLLLLGFAGRRTTFAVLAVLGATPRQLRALPAGEAAVVLVGGFALGGVLGAAIANVLTAVLAGVFDPPPAALAMPWGYLSVTAICGVAAVAAAALAAARRSRRPAVEALRER